jgi:aryl-alcohol dehydrogenase-like predicted oxidoreductase
MWVWCQERGVHLRQLALHFGLAAPMDGIIMPGPANRKEVEEVYEAATTPVPPEIWSAFRETFGVGL